MLVELMAVSNAAGLRLDGAFYAPAAPLPPGRAASAVLLIHGSRGNFYDAATRSMAEDLCREGYACLSLNTNAHDTAWYNPAGADFQGNAYEILADTMGDLRAGLDWLEGQGYGEIALLGHSMGAVRVAYYAATQDDRRVAAVIPVSPVRLSYSYYMESADADEFAANIETARRMVADGRPEDLFRVQFPIPQLFSAAAYLDKHGPEEKYHLIPLAPRICVPLLSLNGSRETHTRLRGMAQDLAAAACHSPHAAAGMIDGGEHSLVNRTAEASAAVINWLSQLELRIKN